MTKNDLFILVTTACVLGIGACVVVLIHANNLDAGFVADHQTIQAAPADACVCNQKILDAIKKQTSDTNKKIDELRLEKIDYNF